MKMTRLNWPLIWTLFLNISFWAVIIAVMYSVTI